MSKALKAGLLCLAVAALVWLVTLWHWQTAERDVSGAEIVGQLFVLPAVLSAALLLALWGVARLRADVAKPLVPTSRPKAAGALGPVEAVRPDERKFSLAIVQAAVNSSAGQSAEQALSQIQSGEVRPGLDPELQDVDGLPVFTARMPDLDVDGLRQSLPDDVGDRVVRALSLLQSPADQLLTRALELAEEWPTHGAASPSSTRPSLLASDDQPPSMKAHLSGMTTPVPAAVTAAAWPPRLTIRLAVPTAWTDAEREHASAWLRMRCGALANDGEAFRQVPPTLHVHALDHTDGLWALIDQQNLQWAREATRQWCVVLVADSAIDEREIERRQAVGELFTGAHQTGRIPGEAAAGLLLATADWPGLPTQFPSPVRLFRPVRLRRDKSADAAGRVGPAVLQDALAQALAVCGAQPADLMQVLADADHRASRTAELFEAVQELAPQLDPMLSVSRVGDACGDLGLASALVPVVLATGLVQKDDAPGATLVALVQSTHDRVVLALLPWTWSPSPAQATT